MAAVNLMWNRLGWQRPGAGIKNFKMDLQSPSQPLRLSVKPKLV